MRRLRQMIAAQQAVKHPANQIETGGVGRGGSRTTLGIARLGQQLRRELARRRHRLALIDAFKEALQALIECAGTGGFGVGLGSAGSCLHALFPPAPQRRKAADLGKGHGLMAIASAEWRERGWQYW